MNEPIACADGHGKSIQVMTQGPPFVIDRVVCTTPEPLPSCRRCGVRIVGHSVETGGWMVRGDRRTEPQALPNSATPSGIA